MLMKLLSFLSFIISLPCLPDQAFISTSQNLTDTSRTSHSEIAQAERKMAVVPKALETRNKRREREREAEARAEEDGRIAEVNTRKHLI